MIFRLDTTLIWDDSKMCQTYTDLSWDASSEKFESYLGRVMDSILVVSERPNNPDAASEIKLDTVYIDSRTDTKENINEAVAFMKQQNIKYKLLNY